MINSAVDRCKHSFTRIIARNADTTNSRTGSIFGKDAIYKDEQPACHLAMHIVLRPRLGWTAVKSIPAALRLAEGLSRLMTRNKSKVCGRLEPRRYGMS